MFIKESERLALLSLPPVAEVKATIEVLKKIQTCADGKEIKRILFDDPSISSLVVVHNIAKIVVLAKEHGVSTTLDILDVDERPGILSFLNEADYSSFVRCITELAST